MSEESGGAAEQPRLVVALRDGQRAEVFGDRITVGDQTYPLADLTFAGLVIDPSAPPAAPGAPPPPALLLWLRDGRDIVLAPAEPPAAWQLLGAVHQARPDLRAASAQWASPPPPSPPPGYGYPYGSPYGYYPRPASSGNDTVLAGLAHLGVFLGGWLLPLIIWLVTRTSAPYASRQAKQAFFWQLAFFVLGILTYVGLFGTFIASSIAATSYGPYGGSGTDPFILGPFGALLLFYAVFFGGYLINIIFAIIGAVKGFQGKPFHYPLLGWLH